MSDRKKYRPYGVNPTAHVMAMMGAACMSKTDALTRADRLAQCVEKASRAEASLNDWRHLFDCVNITEELCKAKVAQGLEVIEALQVVIADIHDRHKATGTRSLRAAELAALRDFAADYAAIISGVTQQQYMQAQCKVEDRVRRILSGERIPASVRVVEAAL
jgi:hypothetical protein